MKSRLVLILVIFGLAVTDIGSQSRASASLNGRVTTLMGVPLRDVEIKIVPDNGTSMAVKTNLQGEYYVKGRAIRGHDNFVWIAGIL